MQPGFIIALLAACLLGCNPVYADEKQPNTAHFNMGFYAVSIAEQANRSDIEVALSFWAGELFELELTFNS